MKMLMSYFFLAMMFLPAQKLVSGDNQSPKVESKVGTTLVYEMNYQGNVYSYVLNIIQNDSLDLSFDWKMTAPLIKSGTIIMTKNALQNASLMSTAFVPGEKELENAVMILVSKKMQDEINTRQSTGIYLSPTDAQPVKFIKQENAMANCKVNGNMETLFSTYLTGMRMGKELNIRYWDNPDFPVILSMDQGFTLKLVEIKTK